MAKMIKRSLAFLLAMIMMMSALGVSALADEDEGEKVYSVGETVETAESTAPAYATEAESYWAQTGQRNDTASAPVCGIEDHTHGGDCTATEIDAGEYVEGDPDYYKVENATYYELTCVKEVGHTHSADCYTVKYEGDTGRDSGFPRDDRYNGMVATVNGVEYMYKRIGRNDPSNGWYTLTCTVEENHTHGAECYTEVTKEAYDLLDASKQYSEINSTTYYKYDCTAHTHVDACYPVLYTWTVTAYSVDGVSITDDIINTGLLKAEVTGRASTYQWYRLVSGEYKPIEGETGATLNVAKANAANSSLQTYKVVAAAGESSEEAVYQVPYYTALQNGSFENPNKRYGNTDWTGISWLPNGTGGLIWRTTGSDQRIEIGNTEGWNNQNSLEYWYKCNVAPNGVQFAELNCNAYGALYQDIMTEPGSTLFWSCAHRGRDGNDTMKVIIGSTSSIPAGWNPTSSSDVYGKVVATDTAGNTKWNYMDGSYVVPEGQYVTRFYFVSVSAAGGPTQGNFLDYINFSSTPADPPPTYVAYTINYHVDGVLDDTQSGAAVAGDSVAPNKLDDYANYDAQADYSETKLAITDTAANNVLDLYFTTPEYKIEYYTKGYEASDYSKVTDSDVLSKLTVSGKAVYTTVISSVSSAPATLTVGGVTYDYASTTGITVTKGEANIVKLYYDEPAPATYTYTVEYREGSVSGAKLAADKTVSDQLAGTYTENAKTIAGYTADAATKDITVSADGQVVTFIYSKDTVSISGLKTWSGSDERPAIVVALMNGETQVATTSVASDNTYGFTLDKYSYSKDAKGYITGASEIDYYGYSIKELSIGGTEVANDKVTVYGGDKALGYWTVSYDGNDITNTYTAYTYNDTGYGKFTVAKQDGDGNALMGATFTLFKFDEEAEDNIGEYVAAGSTTKTVESVDSYQDVVFTNLEAGKYILKETIVPTGYIGAGNWTVTVTKDYTVKLAGPTLEGNVFTSIYQWVVGIAPDSGYTGGTLTVTNTRVAASTDWGSLEVSKTNDGFTPASVTISVTGPNYSEEIVLDGKTDDVETSAWTAVLTGLAAGEYTISETAVTGIDGYSYTTEYTNKKVTLESSYDFATNKTTVESGSANVKNTYTRDTGSIVVTKAIAGESVTLGTDFRILVSDASGVVKTLGLAAADGVQGPDVEGTMKWTVSGLPTGTYTISETNEDVESYTCDKSFETDADSEAAGWQVNVAKNTPANAAITNTYAQDMGDPILNPVTLTIAKVDSADTTKLLGGAVFTLTKKDAEHTLTTSGTEGAGFGKASITFDSESDVGEYTLKETTAPTGYDPDDTTWTVKVTESEVRIVKNGNIWNEIKDLITGIFQGQEAATGYNAETNTLTVKNTLKTYSVTYEFTGDVPSDAALPEGNPFSVDHGGSHTVAANATTTATAKDGIPGTWKFNGWDRSGEITNITDSIVIKGTWTFTPASYTVTYKWKDIAPSDAALPVGNPYSVTHGGSHTVAGASTTNETAKDGVPGTWKFNGWNKTSAELTSITSNTVIEGDWDFTPTTYTVTYFPGTQGTWAKTGDIHGGIEFQADTPDYVGDETADHNPGYEFDKWSPAVADKVTESAEYTALWTAIDYSVKYTVTGEIAPEGSSTGVQDALGLSKKNVGNEITVAAPLTTAANSKGDVPGTWSFSGWTIKTEGVSAAEGKFNMPAKNVELEGYWSFTPRGQYSVSYSFRNGPSGQTLPDSANYYETNTVNVDAKSYDVVEGTYEGKLGTWSFKGWDSFKYDTDKNVTVTDNKFQMPAGSVAISGEWEFTAYTGELTIEKTVEGYGADKTYNFKITGPDGYEKNVSIDFSVDGETNFVTVDNLKPGNYTVEEVDAEIANYSLTTRYSSDSDINATSPQPGDAQPTGITVTVGEKSIVTVSNEYRRNPVPPTTTPTPPTEPSESPDIDIDDPDTPLDPSPDLPDEPDVDIGDEDTPLAPAPGEDVTIEDGDTPLAAAPQTGDNAAITLLIVLMSISAIGLVILVIGGKKKKNSGR